MHYSPALPHYTFVDGIFSYSHTVTFSGKCLITSNILINHTSHICKCEEILPYISLFNHINSLQYALSSDRFFYILI